MRTLDTTSRFVGIITLLAILSAYSAFASPDGGDADTTAFETHAAASR